LLTSRKCEPRHTSLPARLASGQPIARASPAKLTSTRPLGGIRANPGGGPPSFSRSGALGTLPTTSTYSPSSLRFSVLSRREAGGASWRWMRAGLLRAVSPGKAMTKLFA
jgi:hypothetical protein